MDRMEKKPQVAFIVNLASSDSAQASTTLVHHLDQLFQGNQVPVTWSVSGYQQAKHFFHRQLNHQGPELALQVTTSEQVPAKKMHADLKQQVYALEGMTGISTSLVLGHSDELRSRAAILAQEGIEAILSLTTSAENCFSKPLPCGLWQLNPTVILPQPRRLWNLLPAKRLDVQKLGISQGSTRATIVSIQAKELGSQGSSSCRELGQLLQEVRHVAKQGNLEVARLSTIVSDLADQRRIKPQRSILRAAA